MILCQVMQLRRGGGVPGVKHTPVHPHRPPNTVPVSRTKLNTRSVRSRPIMLENAISLSAL